MKIATLLQDKSARPVLSMPTDAAMIDAKVRSADEIRERDSIKIYAAVLAAAGQPEKRQLGTVLSDFVSEATFTCASMDELVSVLLARDLSRLCTIRVDAANSPALAERINTLVAHSVKWVHEGVPDHVTLKEFLLFVGINNATRRFQKWNLLGVNKSTADLVRVLRDLPDYVCEGAKTLIDRIDALFAKPVGAAAAAATAAADAAVAIDEEDEPLAKRRLRMSPFADNLYRMLSALDVFVGALPFCAANELQAVARAMRRAWTPAPFEAPDVSLAISIADGDSTSVFFDALSAKFKGAAERLLRNDTTLPRQRRMLYAKNNASIQMMLPGCSIHRLHQFVHKNELPQLVNSIAPAILEHFFELADTVRDEPGESLYRHFGNWDDATSAVRFNPFFFVASPECWHFTVDACGDLYAVEVIVGSWAAHRVYEELLPCAHFLHLLLPALRAPSAFFNARLLLNHAARIIYLLVTGKTFAPLPTMATVNNLEAVRQWLTTSMTTVDLSGEPLSPELLHLIVNLYCGTIERSAATRQFIANVFSGGFVADAMAGMNTATESEEERQRKFNIVLDCALRAPTLFNGGVRNATARRLLVESNDADGGAEDAMTVLIMQRQQQHEGNWGRPIALNIAGRVQVDNGAAAAAVRRNVVGDVVAAAAAAAAGNIEAPPANSVHQRAYHDALVAFMAQINTNAAGDGYPELHFLRETGRGVGPTLDGMQQIIDAYLAHSGARCYYDESLQCIRVRSDAYMAQLERGDKKDRHLTCKVCHGGGAASSTQPTPPPLHWVDVDYLTGGRFWAAFEARYDAVMFRRAGEGRAGARPIDLFADVCTLNKMSETEMLQHMRATHGRGWQHCWLAEPGAAARAPPSALVVSDPAGVFLATLLNSVTLQRNTLSRLVDPLLLALLFGMPVSHKSIAAHYLQLGEPNLMQFAERCDDNEAGGGGGARTLTVNFLQRHVRNASTLRTLLADSRLMRDRYDVLRRVMIAQPHHTITMLMKRLVGATYARLRTLRIAGLDSAGEAGSGVDTDLLRAAIIGSLRVSVNEDGRHPSLGEALERLGALGNKFESAGYGSMMVVKRFVNVDAEGGGAVRSGANYQTIEFTDAWAKQASAMMKVAREMYRDEVRASVAAGRDADAVYFRLPELLDEFRRTATMVTAVCGLEHSLLSLLLWLMKATRDDLVRFLFAVTGERSLPLATLVALASVPLDAVRVCLGALRGAFEADAAHANTNDYASVWRPRFAITDTHALAKLTAVDNYLAQSAGIDGIFNRMDAASQRINIGIHNVSHPFTDDCRRMSVTGTCGRLLTLDAGLSLTPPHDLHRHLAELFASEQHYGLA
jgi:hypothetical protein